MDQLRLVGECQVKRVEGRHAVRLLVCDAETLLVRGLMEHTKQVLYRNRPVRCGCPGDLAHPLGAMRGSIAEGLDFFTDIGMGGH